MLLVSRLPPWIGETVRELWLRAADTRLLGYRHRLSPWGLGAVPNARSGQQIVDLDALPPFPRRDALLVSHAYRQSSVPHYPSIESWTLVNGVSCGQSAAYRRIQFHTIRKALRAPRRQLPGAFAVFPHLTSHFGHWVGDQLGAMLWFAFNPEVRAGGRRLLLTAPSPEWAGALKELAPPDSLEVLTPEQLLSAQWLLSDALLLPRLGTWQNLALARDLVGAGLHQAVSNPERLFLCSGRSDRLANLREVCAVFERHGYTVLNPIGLPTLTLLQRLRDASRVWCEPGSMALNLLISRTRPYRLFALDSEHARSYPAHLSVLGGGIYNSFQRGLQQPFPCPPADPAPALDCRLHPYQRQLRVDLHALEAALSGERSFS